jgi:hypothetical protein
MADARAMEEQHGREADTKGIPFPKLSGGRAKKSPMAHEEAAEQYGRQLAEHIGKLHGGAYHRSFLKGFTAYGNPAVSGEKVAFSSNVPEKAATRTGGAHMVGAGPLSINISHSKADHSDEMEGSGMQSGRYQGQGTGAGVGDRRKERAAIVNKVMKEQDCSLAQASKYVKDHGLFKAK